jgi:hypothetical protein
MTTNLNNIDLAVFAAEVDSLVAPHVTACERVSRRDAGARILIEVPVKTYRTASGWGDCCGTAYPTDEAFAAAEALAVKYGCKMKFEPCEKGWGSFYFEAK